MRREYILAELTDKAGGFVRQFLPSKSVVSPRAYTTPTALLTVKDTHRIVSDVIATDGARCRVWMISIDGGSLDKHVVLEGRVLTMRGDDAPFGTVTITVVDDVALWDTLLGWQVPTAPLTGQSAAEYATYTGPTETRVKAAIQANVTRLGLPWDIVPTRGKGTSGTLQLRMHEIGSKVIPLLQADRLIPIMRRETTGRWTVDIVEGSTYPRPLTPLSGVLGSWSWVMESDDATDVVIGGRGDGTAREFKAVADAARRARVGYPLEAYVDARQTEEGADITPSGVEKLAETAARSGLTATLRESSWFRFPTAYELGTKVTVQVGAVTVEDVITQIEITHDQSGFRVVPKIGIATEDPQERLVGAVKSIATAVGGQERR